MAANRFVRDFSCLGEVSIWCPAALSDAFTHRWLDIRLALTAGFSMTRWNTGLHIGFVRVNHYRCFALNGIIHLEYPCFSAALNHRVFRTPFLRVRMFECACVWWFVCLITFSERLSATLFERWMTAVDDDTVYAWILQLIRRSTRQWFGSGCLKSFFSGPFFCSWLCFYALLPLAITDSHATWFLETVSALNGVSVDVVMARTTWNTGKMLPA